MLDVHSDPAVLEAAARTYLSLCGDEATWSSTARDARDALVQTWVERLTVLLGDSLKVEVLESVIIVYNSILNTLYFNIYILLLITQAV